MDLTWITINIAKQLDNKRIQVNNRYPGRLYPSGSCRPLYQFQHYANTYLTENLVTKKKLGIAKRSWRASQSGEKILEDCRTFTATATSGLILAGSAF